VIADRLERHLPPGGRVAVGDGAGAPLEIAAALPEAAAALGGVSLLLGWCLQSPVPLPHPGFTDVRIIMGGYGVRAPIRAGAARYVPARYGDLPALLRGPLRPDVLLASLVPVRGGLAFATEVGWQKAAVEAGALVLAEVNHGLPRAAATRPLPADQVVVIEETNRPPITRAAAPRDTELEAIGRCVADLLPDGVSLETAPGQIGEAVLAALDRPVRLCTGALTDGVVRLERDGLLLGTPSASYIIGSTELMAWCDGRPIVAGIEVTHDPGRLDSPAGFVAVNPAFELDSVGNVNSQGFGDDVIAGIGGLHDFAAAGARSARGLSVIALPSRRAGRSTLVPRLSAPPALPRALVDVVVTEHGAADLRGLGDDERTQALRALWSTDVRAAA
jgi:acyl-CoA hydrolase